MALCVVVFAGEPGQQSGCDLQSGLAGTLSLSQHSARVCGSLRTSLATIRQQQEARLWEKRFELRRLSQDPKAGLNTINRVEKELNALEQEFYRKAQRTEAEQRRLLSPEQIKQIKDTSYGNGK
jgi:Spy/CpxP family protein refolding chaperone